MKRKAPKIRIAFSALYLDLDTLKAYNDAGGFLKGDEIINFTSDTIIRCFHSLVPNGAFVVHMGGDDFIAIVPVLHSE